MLDEDHVIAGKPRRRKGDEIRKIDLANASLLAFEHDDFEQPSKSVIRKIKPGDYVKVCRNHERFWLRVSGFEGRKYHGQVANDLIRNQDLDLGDKIYFERKNIYDVILIES